MNTKDVTLEQQLTAELAELGEKDPELAERIRNVFPDWELGSADGSVTLVLLQALEGLRANELDQEHVLRIAGPYFNGSSGSARPLTKKPPCGTSPVATPSGR